MPGQHYFAVYFWKDDRNLKKVGSVLASWVYEHKGIVFVERDHRVVIHFPLSKLHHIEA